MRLYSIEHTRANGDVVDFELSKDKNGRLWFFLYEDLHLSIEIPVTEDMILGMFISSQVADGRVSREAKSQDFE